MIYANVAGQPIAPAPTRPELMEARAAGYLKAAERIAPYALSSAELFAVGVALYWEALDLRANAKIERGDYPSATRRRSARG